MQPHHQRVLKEKQDLDEKIEKLGKFNGGTIFDSLPNEEKQRLIKQYCIMRDYSTILGERISAFQPDFQD